MAIITIYGHVNAAQVTVIHNAIYTACEELDGIYIDDVTFTKYSSGVTVTFEAEELIAALNRENAEVLKNLIRDITNAVNKLS